ncbi:MAG: hypothetical protein HY770_03835 [Chitinivibrionia bacterium]|nr:hypothetical protein [Chitinivibrionia bacterium]
MKRFLVPLVFLSALAMLFGSCILDPEKKPPVVPPDETYKSLKEKDHVLYNFQMAYNNRNIDRYRHILDQDTQTFIFVFSPEDYNADPPKTPQDWGLVKELEVTGKMFKQGGTDPITSISLTLTYAAGDIGWEETTPPAGHETERWYQKMVSYDLTVKTISGNTFFAIDLPSLYVIRYSHNSELSSEPADSVWQIVQWYDLGSAQ